MWPFVIKDALHPWMGACFILLLTSGCRPRDEQPPEIQILSPLEGSIFQFGNQIVVTATARDDEHLEYVQCAITDEAGLTVLNAPVQWLHSNEASLTFQLNFNDVHIETGIHYVRLTAWDGHNERNAFRAIQLIGAPLTLKSIVLARTPNNEHVALDTLYQNQWWPATELNLSYRMGGCDNYHQYLLLAGTGFQGIQTLDASWFNATGQWLPVTNETEYFTCLHHAEPRHTYYIGTADSKLLETGPGAQVLKTIALEPDWIAVQVIYTAGKVCMVAKHLMTGTCQLLVAEPMTGQVIHAVALPQQPVSMVPWNSSGDEVMLLFNSTGNCFLKQYQFGASSLWDPWIVAPDEQVVSAHRAANGIIYIATPTRIWAYQPAGPLAGSGVMLNAQVMHYEVLSGKLWVLNADGLHQVTESAGAVLSTIAVPAGAKDFYLLYNK